MADRQQLLQARRVQLLWDFLIIWQNFFDNLTLKIPNRFSAILAKKPQKVIIDCAAFSSTCTIYVQYFWLYYKCMYYQLCMNIMIQMIYLRNYFFSNIKRSRIVILYQTCVACKAWVTDLQVLQEWQKIPPEDKASLWIINLSIKIWKIEGWGIFITWGLGIFITCGLGIFITWCIFLFLFSQECPEAVLVQTSWETEPTPAGRRSCLQIIKT